eukprot:TRINITY_DN878_c0_g3_i1.p1 TRINITY_DN878_c0_g3~~TRINITY_DN878_c0_g3_i1.p1  ORF type:complete len:1258 (-),score=449.77 TRINITY_DN878_c0_g3_i1:103-3876(-)
MGRQVGKAIPQKGIKQPPRGQNHALSRHKGRPGPGKRGRQPVPLRRLAEEGDEEEEGEGEEGTDAYEYEEAVPEEESGKNRRYDDVDVYEYELPDDFEDEEIDEDMAFTEEDKARFGEREADEEDEDEDGVDEVNLNSDEEEEEEEEEDEEDDDEEEEEVEDVRARNSKTSRKGAKGLKRSEVEEEEEEAEDEEGEGEEDDGEDKEVADMEGRELGEEEDEDDDDEEGDVEARHARMLAQVRGGKEEGAGRDGRITKSAKTKRDVVSEAYPEAEFNLDPTAATTFVGGAQESGDVTVEELLGSLSQAGDGAGGEVGGGAALGALRKRLEQQKKRGGAVVAPLPKPIKERLDRKAGYEKTNEDITKWQTLIKQNREAATLVLNRKPALPGLTTAAIAAKFTPATEMEQTISKLLQEAGADSEKAAEEEEALSLNKLTVEEVLERKERLSRMRALLFRSELKAKRVKKIKSKTFHRLLLKSEKRARANAAGGDASAHMDPEEAKELAIKQEYKRAQERMTLRHRNTSKWAKRILEKGLAAHNRPESEGTRTAIAEQLRVHSELRRKIHSATVGREDDDDESDDSDYDSSDEDEGENGAEVGDGGGVGRAGLEGVGGEGGGLVLKRQRAKLLAKSKAKALKELEANGEAEIPATGLFALPFMARAIEKKRKEAEADAMALLRDLDREAERGDGSGDDDEQDEDDAAPTAPSGRQAFGPGMTTSSAARAGKEDEGEDAEGSDEERGPLEGESEEEGGGNGEWGPSSVNERRGRGNGGGNGAVQVGTKGGRAKKAGGRGSGAEGELHEGGYQTKAAAMSGGLVVRSSGPVIIDQTTPLKTAAASPLTGEADDLDADAFGRQPSGVEGGNGPTSSQPSGRSARNREKDGRGVTPKKPSLREGQGVGERLSPLSERDEGVNGANGSGVGRGGRRGSQSGASVPSTIPGLNPSLFGDFEGEEEAEFKEEKSFSSISKAARADTTATSAKAEGQLQVGKGNGVPPDKDDDPHENPDTTGNEIDDIDNDVDNDVDGFADPSAMDTGLGLGTPVEVSSGAFLAPLASLSQQDLLRRAFAGDDVEAEFDEEKEKALDEEVPRPEGPVTLPGWGQWAHVQAKKGPPQWILKEREKLAKQREAALGSRTDAKLKHVLISERLDKKALKYQHEGVPYPFTSREAYEQSLRAPIGREYNTDEAFRNKTRPAVLKSSGVIIDPIKYLPSENATKATSRVVNQGRGRGEKRQKGPSGKKGTGNPMKKAKFKVGKE